MNNEKCPQCDGLLIKMFDQNKLIVNKCPLCGYVKQDDNSVSGEYRNYEWMKKVFIPNKKKLMDDGDKIIVISYVKSIRESRCISQKQIAEILGFTEQRYGNVERHYNAPSVILTAQFACILGVSNGELYKPVQVSKQTYNELSYLKIDKNKVTTFDELKDIVCKMEDLEYTNPEEYIKLKKEYDEIANNNFTSLFLKRGELVENFYWEEYLKMKGIADNTDK